MICNASDEKNQVLRAVTKKKHQPNVLMMKNSPHDANVFFTPIDDSVIEREIRNRNKKESTP